MRRRHAVLLCRLLLALLALLPGRNASAAAAVGWIDDIDREGGVHGWTAEPGVEAPIQVYVEVFGLGADGAVGPLFHDATVLADEPRPDIPPSDNRVVGERHGYHVALSPTPGGYMVRARGLAAEHGWLLPGEVRFARVIAEPDRTDFWVRYAGVVGGLDRSGDYESYPTAMVDGGTIKMWFAGGPGDKIYYASSASPFSGFQVAGGFAPVVSESPPGGADSGLVADPSVIKVPFPDPNVPYRFFMYYTGTPNAAGDLNAVFAAISTDGVQWTKMDSRDHSFGGAWPVIQAQAPRAGDYGAGQSSVIWVPGGLGGMPGGIVQYFTDTSAPGPCVGVSVDGGWTFPRQESPLPGFGDYTWDMKLHDPTGRVMAFLAHPGGVGGDQKRHGWIGIAVAGDGRHFGPQVQIPMAWLTTDTDRQCINNGGLLGTPEGHIVGSETVFYFGAGYGMQDDPRVYGRWPPADWDIAAVLVRLHDCNLPEICGDGVDQDCDGIDPPCPCPDQDGDGHQALACGGDDCDDARADVHPGAPEICGDGVDQDCDGIDPPCPCPDQDDDGHQALACGGDDCDDACPDVHPGMPEICGDGVDQDCDGVDPPCPAGDAGIADVGHPATDVATNDDAGRWPDDAGGHNEVGLSPEGPLTQGEDNIGASCACQAPTGGARHPSGEFLLLLLGVWSRSLGRSRRPRRSPR